MPSPMLGSTPNPEAGKKLRAERFRLGLSTRAVQDLSQRIAREKNNQEYYLSHAWLTDAENGKFTPTLYKLYSLSLIYKCNCIDMMAFFGINALDVAREQRLVRLPHTHLLGSSLELPGQKIVVPVDLRQDVELARTNLLSRMFEAYAQIPVELLQQLDSEHSLCGYVGLEDYTLDPIIRPGAFVAIDTRQNKVKMGNWRNVTDRPIYFVELRDGYVCCWCELNGNHLILIPCPQSSVQVRQVRYPTEGDLVGRVTAVTMPLAEVERNPTSELPAKLHPAGQQNRRT
jgi:transcriptional regulator with XRE-family HTH domain